MEEQNTNKILSSEKFTKFNISYPVIVKGWEVCQGQRFEQRYLSIHFQKISDEIFAFKINVTCLNSYDEIIEEYKDISIKDVNRKNVNFFENITLAPNTEKVFVSLRQYILTDATVGPLDNDNEIVEYKFRRFEDVEDEQAAAQLMPSAKGFPIENGSHWYCACGKLNWKHSDTCSACHNDKKQVFSKITDKAIEKEKHAHKEKEIEHKKNKRKVAVTMTSVISALVIFAIVISILCATVIPMNSMTVDGLEFEKTNGSYTLVKCNNYDRDISIPSEIRGLKVTKIGKNAFQDCNNLRNIKIPNTVTDIDEFAFCNCSNLTNIKLPNSVTYIGRSSFENCKSFTSINLPKNLERMGNMAFRNCSNLKSIVLPASLEYIGVYVFDYDTNLTIYCEASERPKYWDGGWNQIKVNAYTFMYAPVVWGYICE